MLLSNGWTEASANNLPAGNYAIEILDANGCPATLNFEINQPLALQANAAATPETAPGANNGTASAAPVGGTGTYNYVWSNGATTASLQNLAPGTYSVVISDENGCSVSQSVIVGAAGCAMLADVFAVQISCNGLTDGQATVSVTAGGVAPFQYLWSNGQTTATATQLSAGNYSVVVTDVVGCETEQSISISEPSAIEVQLTHQEDVICPNDATGSASIEAAGGTGTLQILWSNGQTTATATQLTAGFHTAVITDANGCAKSLQVEILANDHIAPLVSAQNATIQINAAGTANLTLTNLAAQYSDNCSVKNAWVEPAQFDCSMLGEHIVTVKVEDHAGNLAQTTATVRVEDRLAPTVQCPINLARCAGDNIVDYPAPTASDNCAGQGQWNLLEGLPSGATFPSGITRQVYTYTDASGNVGQCSFFIEILTPTTASGFNFGGCFQTCEGFVQVANVSGGLPPYTYEWSNGQSGNTATGICSAGVSLQIADGAGCRTPQSVPFVAPAPLLIAGTTITNPTQGSQNGGISVNVAGGNAPYSYLWTDAAGNTVGTEKDLKGVGEGTYYLQITDANGCIVRPTEGFVLQATINTTEPTWSKGMKIVPNPSHGFVQVQFENLPKQEVEVTILDATGRQTLQIISVGEAFIELDLTSLPSAIYTVRLRSAGEVSMKKLVLNK